MALSQGWAAAEAATPGIGPRSILIGQSAAFSGPSGELGREFRKGAHAAINEVNSQGGIHGRQIVMIYRDDRYEPDLARRNTQMLIQGDKVFALFGYVGTPTVKAALPLINQTGIPLIGPLTGAQIIRNPLNRLIFNVRASYHQEIEAIVNYFVRFGRSAIAVAYQNDAYGQDGLAGAVQALRKRNLQPVATARVERNSADTNGAARLIALAKPDAVLMISSYGTVASLIQNLRKRGSDAQMASVSFVGSNALVRALPASMRHGIGISQVVPYPWNVRVPLVRDYQKSLRRHVSDGTQGFTSLEGYLAAKVLIQGLKRAGPEPTRETLIQALERMGTVDLGGYQLRLSERSHSGSDFVEMTFLIGRDGAFIH